MSEEDEGGMGGMMGMGGMFAQLGIVNKLTTGHVVVDVMIAMLIPIIMKFVTQEWQKIQQYIQTYILRLRDEWSDSYTCTISWTKVGYYDYSDDGYGSPNNVLQEALDLYIGKQKNLVYTFKQSQANLMQTRTYIDTESEEENQQSKSGESDEVSDNNDHYTNWLNQHEVNCSPPLDVYITLEPNLRFMHSKSDTTQGQTAVSTKIYTLEARGEEPQKQVEAYLQKAYDYYKFLKAKKKGRKLRFYYRPIFERKTIADEEKGLLFKSYQLSDEKTFDCWFHREKQELLQLVDDFMYKQGKFSITGYPNKLGLLLWGPPGTGKTSLIKALANYTNRSIVEVPLTQIETNQMLLDVMFDRKYLIQGESVPQTLPLNKIIFVFEDVDAAADVVRARTQTTVTRTSFNVPSQTFTVESFLKSDDLNEEVTVKRQGSTEIKKGVSNKMKGGLPGSPFQGPEKPTETTTETKITSKSSKKSPWDDSDKLNLAGLLNALDGVLDAPQRLIVMTTNHPEQLDPALIRPGRINKKLYLGRLFKQEALGMVQHYFPEASQEQLQKFKNQFIEDAVTPAELESLCGVSPTVDDLIAKIIARFSHI